MEHISASIELLLLAFISGGHPGRQDPTDHSLVQLSRYLAVLAISLQTQACPGYLAALAGDALSNLHSHAEVTVADVLKPDGTSGAIAKGKLRRS